MKMGNKWLGLAVILTVALGCSYGADTSGSFPDEASFGKRADVIKIDSMTVFGRLEKSPVEFLHDAHTEALARKKKDCSACHLSKNNRIFPKFKRFANTDKTEVMNLYHKACISCHGEMALAQEKSGPVDCEDCHNGRQKYRSSRRSIGFDKALHYAHSKNSGDKCEKCHHAYNQTKKELFYDKGKEGTCRYCHGDKTEDNRIAMREASHLACINCHLNTPVTEQINPPRNCAGCHDPIEQQKIKAQADIPRMNRNQPDIVLIKADLKTPKAEVRRNRMNFVPFDHKGHEASNDTCRVCHHASLQACTACHTLDGSSNAPIAPKAVILERAMHKIDSTRSCQGCHEAAKQDKNCAGCHARISQRLSTSDEACIQCHSIPIQNLPLSATEQDEKALTRSTLLSTKRMTEAYAQDDIPEVVRIQRISKEYEAVDMPHRQIVNALVMRIKDNPLSDYFHTGKDTICQGCHHHSPASPKPPQCTNCHFERWDAYTPSKPAILGAYHQQCMGCHKQMDIEKAVGCTECHKSKSPE